MNISTSTNIQQMYAKVLAENLMHCQERLAILTSNRKILCQTLSSVDISLNVLLFGCLLPLSLTEKPTKCMRDLYVYVIMITLRGITKFYANKIIQQLTIEIFRCPKVLFPPIMNKIFMLRNITFKINILRDINSRLPKIV